MFGSLTGIVSHTRRVQTLYKNALRNLKAVYDGRAPFRYQVTSLRAKFDQYKVIKDMRVAYELVEKGEKELKSKLHWHPRKCKYKKESY